MHFKRKLHILLYFMGMAALLLLTSCIDEPIARGADSRFFDLAVFMDNQINLLDSLNPEVKKEVLIDGSRETHTIQDVNWARELELFVQADISKPALQTGYEVEDTSKQIRIFRAKKNENPAVKYLKVTFDEQTEQIMAIEAVISQSNYLYHSEKKISLQCRKLSGNQALIKSYQIVGFQKLIFNDSIPYEVEAEVLSNQI